MDYSKYKYWYIAVLAFAIGFVCFLSVMVMGSFECITVLNSGTYIGEKVKTESGKVYCSYKGIKYGEVVERFKEAKPVGNSKKAFEAKTFGPACYQNITLQPLPYQYKLPISEDCLYLNVYSPEIKLNNSLPVIAFIHGGLFIKGATNFYNPEYYMNTGKVVIVTLAYRLNAFGFLFLDDPEYPANIGIRDQILALRWIQSYVKYFGGDPKRVTINGESAGAASVAILLNSPQAKGLFVGAISESGVDSARYSLQPRCTGIRSRNLLAEKIGCKEQIPINGKIDALVECLRKKTAQEILETSLRFPAWLTLHPYPPIVESLSVPNPVITYFPWLNSSDSSDLVPWMTGVNSCEGTLLMNIIKMLSPGADLSYVLNYGSTNTYDFLYFKYLAPDYKVKSKELAYYYYNLNIDSLKLGLSLIFQDGFSYYPLVRSLKPIHSPTYVYYFNITRSSSILSAAGHGDQLKYFWLAPWNKLDITEIQTSKDLVNTWIQFAYYQVPKYKNATWEKYDYKKDEMFMINSDEAKMIPNPNKVNNKFWKNLHIDDSPNTTNCTEI